MRNLIKRLAALEARIPKPATSISEEWVSSEELRELAYFCLVHNILRFDDTGQRVMGDSAFGCDYGWLADEVNQAIAANPDVLPIFPVTTDQAKQALAALDAGHMVISETRYGNGRLAYKRLGRAWNGPSLGDLPYITGRAIEVLNAQLIEPVELTKEKVKELLKMRIEVDTV